jgi:glycerol-3-phosphate dehydrogenase subunit C
MSTDPAFDMRQARFWDAAAVETELRRVYDVCNGCRRCLPLCPSFRVMFERIDVEAVDGDVEKLPAADVKEVVDLCYQCKLCYNHCPYTPPHRWAIDFPRLMLRARAAEARRVGVTRQDRMLGNTGLVGTLGSLTAPLSNWMNELAVHRAFMQSVVGIHRKRRLPKFHRPTFSTWFKSRPKTAAVTADRASAAGVAISPEGGLRRPSPLGRVPAAKKIALFATCTVEYNAPAIGRAAVRVLEHNGVDVALPAQGCCGMPYLDGGAVEECRALVRDNVRTLAAAVREGCDIVTPGPTCSYMLKQEYPWLEDSDDARLVAGHTRDLFEYLAGLHAGGALDTRFSRPIGAVAYHVPCHLRAQNIGTKSADVLRLIPGSEIQVIERCSAVDGTWGFKTEYFDLSMKVAAPLFDAVRATGAPTVATDCPLAALQIAQGTGVEPRHPIQLLARAYGLEDA